MPHQPQNKVEIYPTGAVLPDNLLRMYIYFPREMSTHDSLEHIDVLNADGEPVEGVFLSPKYELWSPDHRRLTLLLDPGRVKTGLAAHDRLGRALIPGRDFTLIIMDTLVGADGCALGAQTTHAFSVGASDFDPPDPENWDLALPAAGTKEPLRIDLGSPHDHVSLAHGLRVVDQDGTLVPGALSLENEESVWVFHPGHAWNNAPYRLTVDSLFEDLAGNRPGALFDRPVVEKPQDWANTIHFRPSETAQKTDVPIGIDD
ncbi:MAG: hypothetical protein AAF665_18300 [Pseudomonadota bacterium]